MTPFHRTSKADFFVLKIPCVLKIFSRPRRGKNGPATGVKVCCGVLWFVTACCSVLQCVAPCCQGALKTVLRPALHTATHCNMLRPWLPYKCSTLQHTATRCNTLQRTATHCNTLQHTKTHYQMLQRTATHCNTLQHNAAHCNILTYTQHLVFFSTQHFFPFFPVQLCRVAKTHRIP